METLRSMSSIQASLPCIRFNPALPLSEWNKIIVPSKLLVIVPNAEKKSEQDSWFVARDLVYITRNELQAKYMGIVSRASDSDYNEDPRIYRLNGVRRLKEYSHGFVSVDSEAERIIRGDKYACRFLDEINNSG